jgi:molybdopterin-guanine dinucleotide biosynthesis protein B
MPPNLPIPIIAVVGSRHSGKTATVEAIVKGLTNKGYKVATAKHIPDPNFTIDTKGRDTYRHTKAGALITTAVAPKEISIIKKTNTTRLSINDITRNCNGKVDITILEGFRSLTAKDLTVPKIISVRNQQEINEATKVFNPILAFTTISPRDTFKEAKTPLLNLQNETEELIRIIDKRIGPIIAKRRETTDSISIEINDTPLPLNPYVQKVTRNVVLAIVSALKGTALEGNENIQIKITNPN